VKAVWGLFFFLLLAASPCSAAQDDIPPAYDEATDPNLTREEWQSRVEAARQRVKALRTARALTPPPETYKSVPDFLDDTTLAKGDIIALPGAFVLFRGEPASIHRPENFETLDIRTLPRCLPSLQPQERAKLTLWPQQ
jgi:hypothetical protein